MNLGRCLDSSSRDRLCPPPPPTGSDGGSVFGAVGELRFTGLGGGGEFVDESSIKLGCQLFVCAFTNVLIIQGMHEYVLVIKVQMKVSV